MTVTSQQVATSSRPPLHLSSSPDIPLPLPGAHCHGRRYGDVLSLFKSGNVQAGKPPPTKSDGNAYYHDDCWIALTKLIANVYRKRGRYTIVYQIRHFVCVCDDDDGVENQGHRVIKFEWVRRRC